MQAISNPRKSLRLRLACPTSLACGGWRWRAETRDVSPAGCCVAAPGALERGVEASAVLESPASPHSLAVRCTVVWCSPAEPWLVGLSFVPEDRGAAAHWFDEVAARHLHHLHEADDRVPDVLPLTARLEVGTAPAGATLRAEQAALLGLAAERASLRTVVGRLAGSWTRSQRALFEMLGNGWVRLDVGPGAGGPDARGHERERRGTPWPTEGQG